MVAFTPPDRPPYLDTVDHDVLEYLYIHGVDDHESSRRQLELKSRRNASVAANRQPNEMLFRIFNSSLNRKALSISRCLCSAGRISGGRSSCLSVAAGARWPS